MEKKIYEAPQAEVVEVFAEGVFCISGQNLESWGYEDYSNGSLWEENLLKGHTDFEEIDFLGSCSPSCSSFM